MIGWDDLEKNYKFLKKYGYKGPVIYSNGSEMNFDYISNNKVINITYEPNFEFIAKIIIFKKNINTIEYEKFRWKNLEKHEYEIYDIGLFLDPRKKIKKSISDKKLEVSNLIYYPHLLKTNEYILNDNFKGFNLLDLFKRIF